MKERATLTRVPIQVHLVAGARPNFVKIAPLWRALSLEEWCDPRIIDTGQHYDREMSAIFFEQFGLPEPAFHLGARAGKHGMQTGTVMIRYEELCLQERPDWTIVVGDVNSTLAAALVAAKLGIPVAHLEAGLRSGDRKMPEEINRLLADRISDLLWTPSRDADENLRGEGIEPSRIELVGNIMIDTLLAHQERIEAEEKGMRARLLPEDEEYVLVTLHRPGNVDREEALTSLTEELLELASWKTVVWPLHPRARARLESFSLLARLREHGGVQLLEPQGYFEFLALVKGAKVVVTDSGGIQEETSILGVPCLTVRNSTERPVTVTMGTNELVSIAKIGERVRARAREPSRACVIPLWDGKTADRVVASLHRASGSP